ncbi:hypothetical protein RS83_02544 [Microbacterium oxydans]|uniref:DUF222 domain-containing protein n=2 Tax=Microbacterium oxydans TaxID=82380 RepID=A0A0F0L2W8_9MICO|nr:hypothetical protein RS83_02544 [Microbacterium oxydans]
MFYTLTMSDTADLTLDLEERRRLLDEWVQTRTEIARLEARASSLISQRIVVHDADVAASPFHRDSIYRSMIAEYSAAGRLPMGSVGFAFAHALALSSSFTAVRSAFESGTITAAHVREICRAGAVVSEAARNEKADAETLRLYETAALVVAERDTAARTRVQARQIAAALVGETIRERHQRAAEERCVTVRSLDDGLALLTAVLPEHLAVAIRDRLTQMSRHILRTRDDREPVLPSDSLDDGADPIFPFDIAPESRDELDEVSAMFGSSVIFGDSDTFTTDPLHGLIDPLTDPLHSPDVVHVPADRRTADQIRADLLVDLLLASDPSEAHGSGLDGITARIQVTVSATTLAGVDDRPAEFDGHGPMHPDIARDLAGRNSGWSLLLDSTGLVTETDTYTPTEGMRRHLRARDQHCRFPGCRMPVHRCDIDHNHDHAKGGRTRLDNLSHFCRGHHTLKHPDIDGRHRWTAHALPGGEIEWISPIGRSYRDHPSRRLMFV